VRAPLPIDSYVPAILERVREHRALVLTAAPGAGKTTRVPPALAADGPVIVLQPRRVAARSIARRIAAEQGWTPGKEVGWHIRFERQFTSETRVLLATEGILTARLQQDPLLSGFRTIILDEFHERTIHADLGIAFARQTWLARPDLRLVIMSATIDAEAVSEYLEGCPVTRVPGSLHPLDIRYMPGTTVAAAAMAATRESPGDVLCFLAGAREIAVAAGELERPAAAGEIRVLPLHGSLSATEQDAAMSPSPGRRIILATNIAETSLTVPGVRAVVDSGEHKVARYDAGRAIDTLQTERIPADSAEQRAGRAGRLGPGLVIRLWDPLDRLAPHRQPEIARIDLSGPLLDVLAWGGDARSFEWFETPPQRARDEAYLLLDALGATERGRLTEMGRRMQRVPVHPRLARILIAAHGSREAAAACALLSERTAAPAASRIAATTDSDLLAAVEGSVPPHVARASRALQALVVRGEASRATHDEFLRALLCGYPDRVGRRRAPGSARFLLTSGHGAVLGDESGVRAAEFVVAIDVVGGRRGDESEARIRLASAVDRDWLVPTERRTEHWLDAQTGSARAAARDYYGAILLSERPAQADAEESSRLLAGAYLARAISESDRQLIRRLAFAGIALDVRELIQRAAREAASLREFDLMSALDWNTRRDLDRLAPERIEVPSGRSARLEYQDDGTVSASIKLQELFGLADTPRVGARQEPVLLALLAPNGRPVQLTRDLRSFWERTYPEVRKELRGRYPRHPWPEDPWTALPTARATKRGV
jgi:ATP-dependent helicase HrpB